MSVVRYAAAVFSSMAADVIRGAARRNQATVRRGRFSRGRGDGAPLPLALTLQIRDGTLRHGTQHPREARAPDHSRRPLRPTCEAGGLDRHRTGSRHRLHGDPDLHKSSNQWAGAPWRRPKWSASVPRGRAPDRPVVAQTILLNMCSPDDAHVPRGSIGAGRRQQLGSAAGSWRRQPRGAPWRAMRQGDDYRCAGWPGRFDEIHLRLQAGGRKSPSRPWRPGDGDRPPLRADRPRSCGR